MFKSTAYILNPIFLLLTWCIFFYREKEPLLWASLSLASIILTAVLISGYNFWRHKLQWFNFLIIYISQFVFLGMLKNITGRYLSAIVICILWAFTWWMLKAYFKNYLAPSQVEYLAFKKYWYILNFWFFVSSCFSLMIFLSLDFYYVVLLVVLVMISMAKDLLSNQKKITWYFWVLSAFFFAQLFMVVYFLPVSFYVAGTLVVLWFYYFVTLLHEDKRKAKWPILTIILVTFFLLASSLYIIL
jgi:hypothetical protein